MVASETGTSHVKTNLLCQDRLSCKVLDNQIMVAAVADGAGSAALAEVGAQIAIETMVQYVFYAIGSGRSDYTVFLREAAEQAREAITTEAQKLGSQVSDFASTLLIAVVGPNGGGALQIGDGVIVVRKEGDGFGWVFWPQHGEYVNTTNFLTDDDAMQNLQIEPLSGKETEIALMSDGLESLALQFVNKWVYEPFFRGMFEPLLGAEGSNEIIHLSQSLKLFLQSERVTSRTDDDVSIILATSQRQLSQAECNIL